MECVSWLLAIAVVWLIVRELRMRDRIASLEASQRAQQQQVATLLERLDGIKRELRSLRPPPVEAPAPAPQVVVAPPPAPLTPIPSPIAHPSPGRGAPPLMPEARSPLSRPGGSAMGEGGQGGEGFTPPPPPAAAPSIFDEARSALGRIPKPAVDWENLVGVRLFSWMAGIMLAIAAILFLRYSIQHGWLSAPIRMAIGVLTGAGLLVACELKAARRYPVTANALDAAGIAILFSTIFASHSLWGLLGATPAFLLMALVAAVAVALAIRRDSPFIALLGLVGGFATPALLSTGQDRPIALFGYLLLLNAGLAWVSLNRRWTILIRLALAATFLYQWYWVLRYLDPGRIPLALGIFLIFPALYLLAPALVRGREGDDDFWKVAALGAGLPLLFAVYLAAAPGFGDHYGLLFGFLLLLGAGLAVFSAVRGPNLPHVAGAAATVLVWMIWLLRSYRSAAWPEVLAFLSAEVLLFLAAPWVSRRLGGRLSPRDGTFAAPLLLSAFPALIVLEPAAASPGLTFGVLFLLLLASAASALIYESGWIHFGSAFFAVAAEAVWSGRHLTPERLLPGLALYAVFGLFYLGVPMVARRLGRKLRPEGASSVLLLAGLALLGFLSLGPVAPSAIWGLALLLTLLNAGLFLEAREERRPALALAGVVLSWFLIGLWWATIPLDGRVVPALLLVALFSVVALAGNAWTARGGEGTEASRGVYLALMGHVFILFVATQRNLALPPWPVFGVLALLVLAAGVAALVLRRGGLQVASLILAHVAILTWMYVAELAPWPAVALAAEAVLAAFGVAWVWMAWRREGGETGDLTVTCARGAVAGLLAAQIVATVSGLADAPPGLALVLPVQVGLLIALLALAWKFDSPGLAPASVASSFLAVAGFWNHDGPYWDHLTLATVILLIYLAYPLVLGRRARPLRQPWLAAVLASAAYFFLARLNLEGLRHGDVIGLLPLFQAGALAILLRKLLDLEPPGERNLGRLALVAGAVLAFVTAAIPLQLEKQWITIGWALLAAALAWLYGRIPHRGLLLWTAGLAAAVFVRLSLNPAVLAYHPRAEMPIWNWYLYTYLVAAAALLAGAWLLHRVDDRLAPALPRLSTLLSAAGGVLLFLLLNIEIADFFSQGPTLTFGFLSGRATLAEGLTYTLGWGIFALALLVTGIAAHSRGARITAIALLLGTVLKGFLLDLAALGGLYRIASFVGLAVCLAAVAVLIQKFVLARTVEEPAE
ncbi:MAG TPA: DUF2339 domain-containing protein [Thermoanaerobaculia bacterium]|nr:DUF2339 domain-containing protein [Thermoanaerobaculia bacterium]